MFEVKKIHSGQYRRYGDSFYEWEIKTDLPEEKVLDKCFKELAKARYPTKEEWWENIANEKKYDMGYYFHGYYTLERVNGYDYGYRFTVCHPYTD